MMIVESGLECEGREGVSACVKGRVVRVCQKGALQR